MGTGTAASGECQQIRLVGTYVFRAVGIFSHNLAVEQIGKCHRSPMDKAVCGSRQSFPLLVVYSSRIEKVSSAPRRYDLWSLGASCGDRGHCR